MLQVVKIENFIGKSNTNSTETFSNANSTETFLNIGSKFHEGISKCFNSELGIKLCVKGYVATFFSMDKIQEILLKNQERLMQFWEKTGQKLTLALINNSYTIYDKVYNNLMDYIFFCTTLLYVLQTDNEKEGLVSDTIQRYLTKGFPISKIYDE